MRREEDGYTLTEMLVVISIIALIAAVLTPNLLQQMNRARMKAAQLQLDTVAADIELFRSDVGRYPTDQEGLDVLVHRPGAIDGWVGPYVKDLKVLNDPWGRPIRYKSISQGQTFEVDSLGPTGAGNDPPLRSPTAPAPQSTPPASTAGGRP